MLTFHTMLIDSEINFSNIDTSKEEEKSIEAEFASKASPPSENLGESPIEQVSPSFFPLQIGRLGEKTVSNGGSVAPL